MNLLSNLLFRKVGFDQIAQDMVSQLVDFLHGGCRAVECHAHIGHLLQRRIVLAGEGENFRPFCLGGLDGRDDIL